jgi:protein O-mannosyl-transferase
VTAPRRNGTHARPFSCQWLLASIVGGFSFRRTFFLNNKVWAKIFPPVILVLLGILAFGPALSYPFVHDDLVFIRDNPHISELTNFQMIFSPAVDPKNGGIVNPYYRPLLEFFYRLQYSFFKAAPSGYHFFNIVIHVLNAFLLWLGFVKVKEEFNNEPELPEKKDEGHDKSLNLLPMAWWIAVIFLLHPIQTESVACISGISNLLVVFFSLNVFLWYLRLGTIAGPRRVFYLFLTLFCYLCAVLVKEQAVVVPLWILGFEVVRVLFRKEPFKEKLFERRLGPFFGIVFLTFCYLGMRQILFGQMSTELLANPNELFLRLKAIPKTVLMYLGLLLVPRGLHYYRTVDILSLDSYGGVWLAGVFAGLVLLIKKLPTAEKRLTIFGLWWFFITLLPMLNILPLVHEYSLIAAFEHFLYWPSVGVIIVCLTVLSGLFRKEFSDRHWQSLKALAGTLIVIVGVFLTRGQIQYWRSEVALFERAAKYEKNFGRLHILLGRAYYFEGHFGAAILQFQAAESIMKGYLTKVKAPEVQRFYESLLTDIYSDWAQSLTSLGRLNEAVTQYQKALRITPRDGNILNNLGTVFLRMGNGGEAKGCFQAAVAISPKNLQARTNFAVCLISQGDFNAAETQLRQVLAIDSNFLSARQNLEVLLQRSR